MPASSIFLLQAFVIVAVPVGLLRVSGLKGLMPLAASKRKGIWMGGAVPLGYRVEDRALHVVEDEAEFVRNLFRRYLEVGGVVRLKTALDAENVRSSGAPARSARAHNQARAEASRAVRAFRRPV
jgi:hypothetical protein